MSKEEKPDNAELSLFTTKFGEKLVALGFDTRFVEEYTALKMRVRELERDRISVRFEYDKEADAAYIYLTEILPGDVKRTLAVYDACEHRWYSHPDGDTVCKVCHQVKGLEEEAYDGINLDMDAERRLLGIEILDASKRLPLSLLASKG